jgi:hypothetical protein
MKLLVLCSAISLGLSVATYAGARDLTFEERAAAQKAIEQVYVVIVDPASGTTTLRGLNFDVTYDPSKVEYVPATSDTSPLFSPNALITVGLSNGQPGDLVVSIQAFRGLPGVTVDAGQHIDLGRSFRRAAFAAFGQTPITMESGEATEPSTDVGFNSALALSYG